MNVIRLKGILICYFVCVTKVAVFGDQVADTVIVVFETKALNKVETLERFLNKPELGYPNDQVRKFRVQQIEKCNECSEGYQTKGSFPFYFIFVPKEVELKEDHGEFFPLAQSDLSNHRLLDSNWFNNTSWEEVRRFLVEHKKELFLIDKSKLIDDNYLVLKVKFDDWTTQY